MTFSKEELKAIENRTPEQLKAINDWWNNLTEQEKTKYLENFKEREKSQDKLKMFVWILILFTFILFPLIAMIIKFAWKNA